MAAQSTRTSSAGHASGAGFGDGILDFFHAVFDFARCAVGAESLYSLSDAELANRGLNRKLVSRYVLTPRFGI